MIRPQPQQTNGKRGRALWGASSARKRRKRCARAFCEKGMYVRTRLRMKKGVVGLLIMWLHRGGSLMPRSLKLLIGLGAWLSAFTARKPHASACDQTGSTPLRCFPAGLMRSKQLPAAPVASIDYIGYKSTGPQPNEYFLLAGGQKGRQKRRKAVDVYRPRPSKARQSIFFVFDRNGR